MEWYMLPEKRQVKGVVVPAKDVESGFHAEKILQWLNLLNTPVTKKMERRIVSHVQQKMGYIYTHVKRKRKSQPHQRRSPGAKERLVLVTVHTEVGIVMIYTNMFQKLKCWLGFHSWEMTRGMMMWCYKCHKPRV